jgi:hypothetical protein
VRRNSLTVPAILLDCSLLSGFPNRGLKISSLSLVFPAQVLSFSNILMMWIYGLSSNVYLFRWKLAVRCRRAEAVSRFLFSTSRSSSRHGLFSIFLLTLTFLVQGSVAPQFFPDRTLAALTFPLDTILRCEDGNLQPRPGEGKGDTGKKSTSHHPIPHNNTFSSFSSLHYYPPTPVWTLHTFSNLSSHCRSYTFPMPSSVPKIMTGDPFHVTGEDFQTAFDHTSCVIRLPSPCGSSIQYIHCWDAVVVAVRGGANQN